MARRHEARKLLALVNRHRRISGLRPLRLNPKLRRVARLRAAKVAARRVLSHAGWVAAFKRVGYFQISSTVGENLAGGHRDITAAYEAWLDSPPHRRNIEDPDYRDMGFARVGRVRVQTFGTRR